MSQQKTINQRGFTIIEVVLVLAIAGLIFLMVFIALPALQRSQRDTQRRDDVSRFISQITTYATNNRGKIPDDTTLAGFQTNYLQWTADELGEFNDPQTGVGYVITYGIAQPTVSGSINYADGAKCNGEIMEASAGNNRVAAVAIKLEGGGVFCQSTQ